MSTKRRPWAAWEDEFLRQRYPDSHSADLAVALDRPLGSVHQHAAKLGLKKSREWIAANAAESMADPNHGGRRHLLGPGHPAYGWNKGKKGTTGTQPGCRATQFKPGRPASEARNYVPIGTTRVTRDGILEKKVTDDPSVYPARRWVAVARLVWEATHGQIPEGHAIVFRPGQRTTVEAEITVDRLECLSRADLARRNYSEKFPIEVRRIHQLRGAITRQINKRAKDAA